MGSFERGMLNTDKNANKSNGQLVAHGNYSSIANCRTKLSAIFRGIFGIFHSMAKFYSFAPRFLAVSLTLLCALLLGIHQFAVTYFNIRGVLFLDTNSSDQIRFRKYHNDAWDLENQSHRSGLLNGWNCRISST